MAPKTKIKKGDSSDVNANVIPWPDLPRKLLYFMARQKDLMIENLGWRGVSKSWRQCDRCSRNRQTSAPAQSQQRWFQLSRSDHDDDDDDDPRPHVLSIPYLPGIYIWNTRRRRQLKEQGYEFWMHFRGCSNGWIVTESEEHLWCSSRYSLSAPLWRWATLPTWDSKFPFKFATVSKNGVMVLTGTTRPAFLIYNYRTHSSGWLPYDSTLIDPYSSEQSMMLFTNAIGFKDKYYALSLQGALAVIEEDNNNNNNNNNDNDNSQFRFKITALCKNRAVPSASSSSRRFVEYLIESDGEILLAFVISRTKKSEFDDVEVYRLDFSGRELWWVKMESIGERALFLGSNCCMCVVNAEQVGCRPNTVYFTHKSIKDSCWKEFDMKTGCIVNSTML